MLHARFYNNNCFGENIEALLSPIEPVVSQECQLNFLTPLRKMAACLDPQTADADTKRILSSIRNSKLVR